MYFRFKRSYLLLIVVVTTLVARSAATRTTTLGSLLPAVLRSRSTGDLEQVALAVYRTVADPDLHAEDTDLGQRLGETVVHIGAEGVQRNTSLLDRFAAGHLGAADDTRPSSWRAMF